MGHLVQITHISQWVSFAARYAGFLLDITAKGTVLLLLAMIAVAACTRGTAATRHLVWAAALLGVLMLPLLGILLPCWRILPLGPEGSSSALVGAPAAEASGRGDLKQTTYAASELEVRQSAPDHAPTALRASMDETARAFSGKISTEATREKSVEKSALSRRVWWLGVLVLGWWAGALMEWAKLAVSVVLLRRLQRWCAEADGTWKTMCAELQTRMGVKRRVEVLQSERKMVPMTFGIWRPKILVPAESNQWSTDRRRMVLLHELAHIRRRDCVTAFMAQAARGLLWFHPLTWLACGRIAVERERACDDMVLQSGTRSTDYAAELLAIASRLPARIAGAHAALAMANASTLEGRLRAIMDVNRNRRRMTSGTMAAIGLVVTGVIVPLAMLRGQEAAPPRAIADKTEKVLQQPAGQKASFYVHDGHIEAKVGEIVLDADEITFQPLGKSGTIFIAEMDNGLVRLREKDKENGKIFVGSRVEITEKGEISAEGGLVPWVQNLLDSGKASDATTRPAEAPDSKPSARAAATVPAIPSADAAERTTLNATKTPIPAAAGTSKVTIDTQDGRLRVTTDGETMEADSLTLTLLKATATQPVEPGVEDLKGMMAIDERALAEAKELERIGRANPGDVDRAQRKLLETKFELDTMLSGLRPEEGEVYIMGAIPRPGVYTITGRKINLLQAMAMCGGDATKPEGIVVTVIHRVGPDAEETTRVLLKTIVADRSKDFILRANDVVMVKKDERVEGLLKKEGELKEEIAVSVREKGSDFPATQDLQGQLGAVQWDIQAIEEGMEKGTEVKEIRSERLEGLMKERAELREQLKGMPMNFGPNNPAVKPVSDKAAGVERQIKEIEEGLGNGKAGAASQAATRP